MTGTDSAISYIQKLANENFWGTVAVKFEGGRIVHLRKEENLKPSELSGTPRKNNATNN